MLLFLFGAVCGLALAALALRGYRAFDGWTGGTSVVRGTRLTVLGLAWAAAVPTGLASAVVCRRRRRACLIIGAAVATGGVLAASVFLLAPPPISHLYAFLSLAASVPFGAAAVGLWPSAHRTAASGASIFVSALLWLLAGTLTALAVLLSYERWHNYDDYYDTALSPSNLGLCLLAATLLLSAAPLVFERPLAAAVAALLAVPAGVAAVVWPYTFGPLGGWQWWEIGSPSAQTTWVVWAGLSALAIAGALSVLVGAVWVGRQRDDAV